MPQKNAKLHLFQSFFDARLQGNINLMWLHCIMFEQTIWNQIHLSLLIHITQVANSNNSVLLLWLPIKKKAMMCDFLIRGNIIPFYRCPIVSSPNKANRKYSFPNLDEQYMYIVELCIVLCNTTLFNTTLFVLSDKKTLIIKIVKWNDKLSKSIS